MWHNTNLIHKGSLILKQCYLVINRILKCFFIKVFKINPEFLSELEIHAAILAEVSRDLSSLMFDQNDIRYVD